MKINIGIKKPKELFLIILRKCVLIFVLSIIFTKSKAQITTFSFGIEDNLKQMILSLEFHENSYKNFVIDSIDLRRSFVGFSSGDMVTPHIKYSSYDQALEIEFDEVDFRTANLIAINLENYFAIKFNSNKIFHFEIKEVQYKLIISFQFYPDKFINNGELFFCRKNKNKSAIGWDVIPKLNTRFLTVENFFPNYVLYRIKHPTDLSNSDFQTVEMRLGNEKSSSVAPSSPASSHKNSQGGKHYDYIFTQSFWLFICAILGGIVSIITIGKAIRDIVHKKNS